MIKITQHWVSLSWWLSLALTHSNYSGVYSQQTHSHATDRKVAPRAEKRWQNRAKRCLFQRPPESFRYILERGFIPPLKNHRRWMQNKKFTLPITSPFWPITSSNLVSDRFFNQSLLQIDSVWNRVVWTNRRPASAAETTPCFFIISVFFRVYFYSWRCTNISVPRMLKRNKTRVSGEKLSRLNLIDTNIKLDKSLLTSCSWTQRWTRQLCKTGKERLPVCVTTCYFLRLNLTLS